MKTVAALFLTMMMTMVFSSESAFAQRGYGRSAAKKKRSGIKGRMAYGVSSDSIMLNQENPAVSGVYYLGRDTYVQGQFLMFNVGDTKTYSIGGYYKKIIWGGVANGFHVGGGYGMGSSGTDATFSRIVANAGAHFIVSKRVLISFDMGFAVGSNKAGDVSSSVMRIGGNSSLLGLSLHWVP